MGTVCCTLRKGSNVSALSTQASGVFECNDLEHCNTTIGRVKGLRGAAQIGPESFQKLQGLTIRQVYKKLDTPMHFLNSTVFPVTNLASSAPGLMRIIKKRAMTPAMLDSIAMQKELDHPHIAKIHELFEDELNYYLIYEELSGGLLFDQMKSAKCFSEENAIIIIRQIFSVVAYLHKKNIVNRTITPENFFFAVEGKLNSLKLFDFFSAVRATPDEKVSPGTTVEWYAAPEVLDRAQYDHKSEVWSSGMILYSLLTEDPRPSLEEDLRPDLQEIEDFNSRAASHLSVDLKKYLQAVLKVNRTERITAEKALTDPLIVKKNKKAYTEKIVERFQRFRVRNIIHQLLLTFMIDRIMTPKEKLYYEEIFEVFDTNSDGVLSRSEMAGKYSKMRGDAIAAQQELRKLFHVLDENNANEITFTEFLLVLFEKSLLLSRKNLTAAFKLLDLDGSGYLTKNELALFLGANRVPETQWDGLLKTLDDNGDNQISFREFCDYLEKE